MLRKARVVVVGILMAGLFCYACIGINNANVFASGCSRSSSAAGPECGSKSGGAPCDISKELGLTPDQQAKIAALKAECEKSGMKCTPECLNKMKEILTPEQVTKLEAIIAKMQGGCTAKH